MCLRSISSWPVAAILISIVTALTVGVVTGVLPLDVALRLGAALVMGD